MPFENAPALFKEVIEKVLEGCEDIASCYINNLIIYSKSLDAHLVKVFDRLRDHYLAAKLSKCEFGKTP